MKLLLDTHVFLWFISGDDRLPDAMRDSIRDTEYCTSNDEAYFHFVAQQ